MEIRCMVAGDFFTNCYIAWGGGPGPAVLIAPADDAPGLLRLLDSLERRGSTLRRCAEAALEAQRPFFAGQTQTLAPMTLTTLAEGLELHPSTVSRAVRGKYLQCRQGTYPLRYFFSLPVSGGVSRQAAKQSLLALVREEDRRRPYSDQDLCRLLEERGIFLARRTVTKYRLELGLGSSAARRK